MTTNRRKGWRACARTGCLSAVLLPIMTDPTFAQNASATAGDGYQLLRYDEDYSRVCLDRRSSDPTVAANELKNFWDPIKCVPLRREGWFVSAGGTIRLQYERYAHPGWGAGIDDRDGYLLQRYMGHGDMHFGPHARVFLQLKSGLEVGRLGGARPFDLDRIDVHQAFVDLGSGPGDRRVIVRAGRQEIALGNSRLVTVREGANVRLSFDGLRTSIVLGRTEAVLFVVQPVQTLAGAFDDAGDHEKTLIGMYAEIMRGGSRGLAVYLIDHRRSAAEFERGTARENRLTTGVRVWGQYEGLRYDVDVVLQRGSFSDGRIAAWAIASDSVYPLSRSRGRPRVGLRLDVASGDPHGSEALGTFSPLYPRGPEIAYPPLIGLSNRIALRPFIELSPGKRFTLSAEFAEFWRQSTADGVYDQGGSLSLPSRGTEAARIGRELTIVGSWKVDRHATVSLSVSRFLAGPYLSAVTPAKDLGFATAVFEYTF